MDETTARAIYVRELMATAADLRAGKPPEAVAPQIDYTLRLVRNETSSQLGPAGPEQAPGQDQSR